MTTLHLIRHGRASALGADYDQLQEQGELQARLLGEHLAARGQRFDAVYVGPLRRQLETLRLMRQAAGAVGAAWPEAVVLDGLAEGPFEHLMRQHVRPRLPQDTRLLAIAQQIRSPSAPGARDAALTELFDYMVELWRRDEVMAEGLETMAGFSARVESALRDIAAREGLGRQVAVVSSSGVIGHMLEQAGLPLPHGASRHRLYNGSVSLLELCADGPQVRAHNLVEHIADPQLLSMI
jgi:broad specificity phosphatase PhoE